MTVNTDSLVKAHKIFYHEYKKSLKRGRYHSEAKFAKGYLVERSTETGKLRYLKKFLPNLRKEEYEDYKDLIFSCRFCDKYFPIWYVSDAEWAETGEAFERMITKQATGSGIIPPDTPLPCIEVVLDGEQYTYKNENEMDRTEHNEHEQEMQLWGLFICRECYEKIFNPEPKYIDVEEKERQLPAESWKSEPPQGYFDWKKERLV
jgi:hypothetical protein